MSDHISGPRALAEPAADITDLYAFTSPERPGHLSLVLNTRPFAETSDGLWEALVYRLRIRPLALAEGESVPFVVSDEEFTFDCTFSAPSLRGTEIQQQGECRTPSGKTVPIKVGETSERDGVRIFAGARWDPFIMDARAALKTIETGQLSFQGTSSIYLDGKNVLGIVLEVDCAKPHRRSRDSSPWSEKRWREECWNFASSAQAGRRSRTCCWRPSSSIK